MCADQAASSDPALKEVPPSVGTSGTSVALAYYGQKRDPPNAPRLQPALSPHRHHGPMHLSRLPLALILITAPLNAQSARVSAIAVDPSQPSLVWVCNRDNDSVSRVDTATANVVEIDVGVMPRSLVLTPDGAHVLVVNQRGNVPRDVNFVTPFSGNELRGSVSVIDVASTSVIAELSFVGVEPYGIAIDPAGKWFAVSGFRSGTITFVDLATLTPTHTHQYERNLNFLSQGTIADHDANRDGLADLGNPRGFVIRSDSTRMWVTHNKSPYLSVLDLVLDSGGLVTGTTLAAKIDTNDYPFDPIFNPAPVQTVESQGVPRFLEDIALSPDEERALVPHLLHNVNHDVNFDFGPGFPGDFANRVYPALTLIDTVQNSFGQAGDTSRRLEHELSTDPTPAEYAAYGKSGLASTGDRLVLGGLGSPVLGGQASFVLSGLQAGDSAMILIGKYPTEVDLGDTGTLLVRRRLERPMPNGQFSIGIPSSGSLEDVTYYAQALVTISATGEQRLTNGLRFHMGSAAHATGSLGHRAGHPSRVAFNDGGDHALLLNRGSEDVFLYEVSGSDLRLRTVFPPRLDFVERRPLQTNTPLGDLPIGIALVPDTSSINDDALLYVMNETTRTLSTLRVDYTTGVIEEALPQIATLTGPDSFTRSERLGEELFEDASRAQTAGNFNNSCASCHFEGGADANVWQRPDGPRSTMPVYGGTLGTGFMLWKGVRLNMGETGPMFGGENGGTGILSDREQQGLVDYHEKLAVPLNPNLDATGQYSANAAFGRDLFFGLDDTGLNPGLRSAACDACHPEAETGSFPGPRFYTVDFVNPLLSGGERLLQLDPNCFTLRENRLIGDGNIANVNTACNVDIDGDGNPDSDRNLDGYVDLETYPVLNLDSASDFRRDDTNSYQCRCSPLFDADCPQNDQRRLFKRGATHFSVPTKLGVFATAPYFHDHAAYSLRTLLWQDDQALDPIYGSPAWPNDPPYPGLNKLFNGEHDILGHEQFVPGSSKVQQTLQSGSPQQARTDMIAILEYIQSL